MSAVRKDSRGMARATEMAVCVSESGDFARIAIILAHAGGAVLYEIDPDWAEQAAETLLDLVESAREMNGDTIGRTEGAA